MCSSANIAIVAKQVRDSLPESSEYCLGMLRHCSYVAAFEALWLQVRFSCVCVCWVQLAGM
jgi:hypothetical protein